MMRNSIFALLSSFLFFACATNKASLAAEKAPQLRFLNQIEIPFNTSFQNTTIGGLSGIDYDAKNDLYYLACDDRSIYQEARFYTASIAITNNAISEVAFKNTYRLQNEKGESFANWETKPNLSTDPEDLRYNAKTKSLLWTSEGARVLSSGKKVLQNPALTIMDTKGTYVTEMKLPENLQMQEFEKGPRNNGTLEGLTFDFDYKNCFANLEEPLFEDGPQSNLNTGGLIRLYQFDTQKNQNIAQFGYRLEPIAKAPSPAGAFAVNGISAIQYYGRNQLLVVERSYSTGTQACTVKIFLCDLKNATDVKNSASLLANNIQLASKKLILNLDELGIFIDNIEGITFGPRLDNGNRSLVLVSDNNFSEKQKTQFLLFEVIE